jgi:hypothetical protein
VRHAYFDVAATLHLEISMKGSQGKRMRRETGKPVLVGISASRLRLVSYPSQRYGWGLMSDMITGYSIAAVGRGMTKYITQLGEHQGKKNETTVRWTAFIV